MHQFCEKIAEILEVDELKPDELLAGFPEWDSLSVLSVLAMIDAKYNINLTASDLEDITTVQSLYELVQSKNGN